MRVPQDGLHCVRTEMPETRWARVSEWRWREGKGIRGRGRGAVEV